jgi:hypothetical protein
MLIYCDRHNKQRLPWQPPTTTNYDHQWTTTLRPSTPTVSAANQWHMEAMMMEDEGSPRCMTPRTSCIGRYMAQNTSFDVFWALGMFFLIISFHYFVTNYFFRNFFTSNYNDDARRASHVMQRDDDGWTTHDSGWRQMTGGEDKWRAVKIKWRAVTPRTRQMTCPGFIGMFFL